MSALTVNRPIGAHFHSSGRKFSYLGEDLDEAFGEPEKCIISFIRSQPETPAFPKERGGYTRIFRGAFLMMSACHDGKEKS
jgi:hypothetical protein